MRHRLDSWHKRLNMVDTFVGTFRAKVLANGGLGGPEFFGRFSLGKMIILHEFFGQL
jgi:hypothetical protein